MVDTVSPEVRSRMMAAVRRKDTKPEMQVRKGLHALGFRFRVHRADLPGNPDIVLPKHEAVVFVHGCFWHGHGCRRSKLPETNREFWAKKISRNQERDRQAVSELQEMGWRCLIVWECALRDRAVFSDPQEAVALVARWLKGRERYGEIPARHPST